MSIQMNELKITIEVVEYLAAEILFYPRLSKKTKVK